MIKEVRKVAIRIAKVIKDKRDKLVADRICLICEEPLGSKPSRRGECPACRAFTTRQIANGEMTEERLIREGKLLELPEHCRGGHQKLHPKRAALLGKRGA